MEAQRRHSMEWFDEGIVLGTRKHGEANAIVELMTRGHGRHLGLVRGAIGGRLRPILQPGNLVSARWHARLDEHLGHFVVEGINLRAASFLPVAHAVHGITYLAELCRLLPERDPHPTVFAIIGSMLDHFEERLSAAGAVARFELSLLAELGFGLDLATCAATGASFDLIYVSPKSGRAVSRGAGEPWRDKLLQLPEFLRTMDEPIAVGTDDLAAAFALTGFFLARDVFEPRGLGLPQSRQHFLAATLSPRQTAQNR
jgi:DNA repair protein RecO (recombination protein O)